MQDDSVKLVPDVEAEVNGVGLVRDIGALRFRNVVLRVRHRWHWSDGGSYRYTDNTVVSKVVLAGDAAGFAAVHIPPGTVPASARYTMDVTVLELTEIRLAAE